MVDAVEHPDHYTLQPVECINITAYCSFCVGSAIKYLWRYEHKGKPLEDLAKARKYVQFIKADQKTLREQDTDIALDLLDKVSQCRFNYIQQKCIESLLYIDRKPSPSVIEETLRELELDIGKLIAGVKAHAE